MKLTDGRSFAPYIGWTRGDYDRACARTAPPPDPAPRHQSPPTTPDEAVAALLRAVGRPSWHARALCRDTPTAVFFSESVASIERARQLCSRCCVAPECLAAAQAGGESGTWAGTTARERTALRVDAA